MKVSQIFVKPALDNWFWVQTTNFFGVVVRRTTSCEPLISNTVCVNYDVDGKPIKVQNSYDPIYLLGFVPGVKSIEIFLMCAQGRIQEFWLGGRESSGII